MDARVQTAALRRATAEVRSEDDCACARCRGGEQPADEESKSDALSACNRDQPDTAAAHSLHRPPPIGHDTCAAVGHGLTTCHFGNLYFGLVNPILECVLSRLFAQTGMSMAQLQTAYPSRSNDFTANELLVIALDCLGLVQIIDHQPERLPQSPLGSIR